MFYKVLDNLLFDGNLSDLRLDDRPKTVLSHRDLPDSLGDNWAVSVLHNWN